MLYEKTKSGSHCGGLYIHNLDTCSGHCGTARDSKWQLASV
jgi:hypothetical protein